MNGRILYLMNNHIPPVACDLKGQYIAFGYYDELSISEKIIENDNLNLVKFWNRSVSDTYQMGGGYSSQAMFLFSDDDDEHFWKNVKLPFLFLIVIQLNQNSNYTFAFCEKLKQKVDAEFANSSFRRGDVKVEAFIYLMLDANDAILAVKSNSYKAGKEIVNSLHKKNNAITFGDKTIYVSYSLTISGMLKNADASEMKDLPDKCQICIVERTPGKVDEMSAKIKSIIGEGREIKQYPVLGRDDDTIEFIPKTWGDITQLYNRNGILFNNEQYREYALSISTQFLYNTINPIHYGDSECNKQELNHSKICDGLKGKIKSKYEALLDNFQKNVVSQKEIAYYKAVWQILNSLEKFEYNFFPDYTFLPIYEPLRMLISKFQNRTDNFVSESSEQGIYYFLTAVNQISQNFIKAERQFVQSPTLNAGSYYVPIKLSAFYSAFTNKVKNYLNQRFGIGNAYEFMLYSGMNEELQVKHVFFSDKEDSRLFLVEIPDTQMFDPKQMMIILTHEIAHCVGSRIRNRKKRYSAVTKAASIVVALSVCVKSNINEYMTESGFNILLEQLEKNMLKSINVAQKVISVSENEKEEICFYSKYLKPVIINGINACLGEYLKDPYSVDTIFIEYFKSLHTEYPQKADDITVLRKDREHCARKIRDRMFKMQRYMVRKQAADKTLPNEIAFRLVYLIKESFADLISVLMLNLSYEDYFETYLKSASKLTIKQILDTDAMIRVALVTETMCSSIEKEKIEENSIWKIEDIALTCEQKSENVREFYRAIIHIHNSVCEPLNMYEYYSLDDQANKNHIGLLDLIVNKPVFDSLIEYLLNCRYEFMKDINNIYYDLLKDIKDDYHIMTEETNISEVISYMVNSIEKYRKNVMGSFKDEHSG